MSPIPPWLRGVWIQARWLNLPSTDTPRISQFCLRNRRVTERRDLRGADEGEIQGIEEQHHVLTAVLGQGDLLEFLVHHCSGRKSGPMAHTKATGVGHVRAVKWNLLADRLMRSRFDYKFHISFITTARLQGHTLLMNNRPWADPSLLRSSTATSPSEPTQRGSR